MYTLSRPCATHLLFIVATCGTSHTLSGYRRAVDSRAQDLTGGEKADFLSAQGKITSGIVYKVQWTELDQRFRASSKPIALETNLWCVHLPGI